MKKSKAEGIALKTHLDRMDRFLVNRPTVSGQTECEVSRT